MMTGEAEVDLDMGLFLGGCEGSDVTNDWDVVLPAGEGVERANC